MRDFRRLWAALSVTLVGSEISILAMPLIAALTLGATPLQMGLLGAAGQAPFLLCSLPAGILADRVRRRPVLVAADLSAAALLVSLPLSMPWGGPTFGHLCAVAFGLGTCAVVTDVAHYAYVPTLVGRDRLTESNSRLQISYSAAEAAGPGLAGALIQLLSAPIAVLLDAVSFVVSAVLLRSIRTPEPRPTGGRRTGPGEGFRLLIGHPLLRPIVVTGALTALFDSGLLALYVLYATRELGLSPVVIGLVFAAGGAGAIPGALVARWAGRRFGVGPAIIGGWALAGFAPLVVPLAAGPVAVVAVLLGAARAFGWLAFTVANIHQWSLRQSVTPDHLAGRVTAAHRFIVCGAGALGALGGGALASVIGLRPTLAVCAAGILLSVLCAYFSGLRGFRGPEGRPAVVAGAGGGQQPGHR